jgi:16S rRNA (cytidine1402-2'-O)-methyltransferase
VAGLLYIVATPIGNLEDITLRALRALKEADLIAAEDTRHTQILLAHYDIRTPLASYHEHNEKTKAATLVEQLMAGKTIALVSDAGTPTISDPGYRVIAAAVAAGIKVVPVPGAAAFVAALSASGLPTDRFVFEGFLSNKKKQRRACLRALVNETRTLIFYEAPHRLNESLGDIYELLGDREIVIAREVSKIHEEFLRGGVSELIAKLADQEVRGEITLIIKGTAGAAAVSDETIKTEIGQLKADGLRVKEIADILGEKYALAKRDIYRMAFDRQGWESKR